MANAFTDDPTPEAFEASALNLLQRHESGQEISIPEIWPTHRLIVLMTPDFDLENQVEHPLAITRERVALAVEEYRNGRRGGIRTTFGWVPE